MTTEMPIEHAAGGVVYSYGAAGQLYVALIFDKHGNWGLPKGHLHEDEDETQAARREIAEETGLMCAIGEPVQRITYTVQKKGEWRLKHVDYFLARSATPAELVPQTDEGIIEARWLLPPEALALVTLDQVRGVVQRALHMLAE
jgi:8-oxo-dGTP pyrophosphatase MutT (NUDIX family)